MWVLLQISSLIRENEWQNKAGRSRLVNRRLKFQHNKLAMEKYRYTPYHTEVHAKNAVYASIK